MAPKAKRSGGKQSSPPMKGLTVEIMHGGDAIGRGIVEKVHNLDTLHGSRLPTGCYAISVNTIYLNKNAPLPFPPPLDLSIKTLQEALGTTIAWPKESLRLVLSEFPSTEEASAVEKATKMMETKEMDVTTEVTPDEIVKSPSPKRSRPSKPPVTYKKESRKSVKKVESTSKIPSSEEEIDDDEIAGYVKPAGAPSNFDDKDFPLNTDVTLRQDVLAEHLRKCEDTRVEVLPNIPLCRLMKLEKARQVSWDPKRLVSLEETFLVEGYYAPKGSFICSVDAPNHPVVTVSEEMKDKWDPIWKELNEEFEKEIQDTCWADLSNKMFYTWDGNHRLTAWMNVLERDDCREDASLHPRVRVQLVKADTMNETDMLSIVMRINRLNDVGYVKTSYTDMLWMVRAMGEASKESLVEKIPNTVFTWMQKDIDNKVLKKTWYNAPVAVMSQLLHPEKYTLAMREVLAKKESMLPIEFQAQYKKAFFDADGPSRRLTKHALAIVDPALGEDWWKTLRSIEWVNRAKWLTDERLYSLACADLPIIKKVFFLRAMASSDITNIKNLHIPENADHIAFRDWIRVEVLWNALGKEARNATVAFPSIVQALPKGEGLDIYMEMIKDQHRMGAFSTEIDIMKTRSKSKAQNTKSAFKNAGFRCFYRWLLRRGASARSLKPLATMLEVETENSVYHAFQAARNFEKKIYEKCPWFLEYKEGKFPSNEEELYSAAVKERTLRASRLLTTEQTEQATSSQPAKDTESKDETSETHKETDEEKDETDVDVVGVDEVEGNLQKQIVPVSVTAKTSKTSSSKRKHSEQTTHEDIESDPELKAYIEGLEDLIEKPKKPDDCIEGRDGGSIQLAALDMNMEDSAMSRHLLEQLQWCTGRPRHSFIDNEPQVTSVNLSIVFLPTNSTINGIDDENIPAWNSMEITEFSKLLRVAFTTADDSGTLLILCLPTLHCMVGSVAGATGWREDHVTTVVCKTPVCTQKGIKNRSLLLTVWKKDSFCDPFFRPEKDVLYDSNESHDWTLQTNGNPLRGGFERSEEFLSQIIKDYSNPEDTIVQYGGDTGVLPVVASNLGRHVLVYERDQEYMEELKDLLKMQKTRLLHQEQGTSIILAKKQKQLQDTRAKDKTKLLE